jgi:hypothetical protein
MKTPDALVLVRELRAELLHDIFFAQAVINASEEDTGAVARIIELSRQLRSNKLSESDRAAHEHIKHVERSMSGHTKPKLRAEARRVIKVGSSTLSKGRIQ